MIVSITFRHGTENKRLRCRVGANCMLLTRFMPTITRIQVIFCKETRYNKPSDLVSCHIAVDAPNKQHVNVYEHQSNDYLAFDRALERVANKLSRMKPQTSNYAAQRYAV